MGELSKGAFEKKGDPRVETVKTHSLAMWCSLCVGAAETGDALTMPVHLMQGVLA